MTDNELKAIPQYFGYYADRNGNIYSFRSGMKRLLKQRIHRGYYHVTLRDMDFPVRQHKEPVHKLVLNAFVGERSNEQVCRHLNGNALDNRLENLRWGTTKENVADSIMHGTAVCLRHGQEAVASKLKETDIKTIKRMYKDGHLQKEIASVFSISQHHVSDIVNGRTWTHLVG